MGREGIGTEGLVGDHLLCRVDRSWFANPFQGDDFLHMYAENSTALKIQADVASRAFWDSLVRRSGVRMVLRTTRRR